MTAWAIARAATIDLSIPVGSSATHYATSSGPAGFVANLYAFALLISSALAFGVIVYGGVKYAAGRGNPSAESEARSWITGALIGLLLLAGAYIILYTINPNIFSFSLPSLTQPSQ